MPRFCGNPTCDRHHIRCEDSTDCFDVEDERSGRRERILRMPYARRVMTPFGTQTTIEFYLCDRCHGAVQMATASVNFDALEKKND